MAEDWIIPVIGHVFVLNLVRSIIEYTMESSTSIEDGNQPSVYVITFFFTYIVFPLYKIIVGTWVE